MEPKLNYTFKRRSQSFFEWFYETIKSEQYFTTDAVISMDSAYANR